MRRPVGQNTSSPALLQKLQSQLLEKGAYCSPNNGQIRRHFCCQRHPSPVSALRNWRRIRFVNRVNGRNAQRYNRLRSVKLTWWAVEIRCANHLPEPEQHGKEQKGLRFGLRAPGVRAQVLLFIIGLAILPEPPEDFEPAVG